MKMYRWFEILFTLKLCLVILAVPRGNVFAHPLNIALNFVVGSTTDSDTVADFNNDGRPDLAVASDAATGHRDVSMTTSAGIGTLTDGFTGNTTTLAGGAFYNQANANLYVKDDTTPGPADHTFRYGPQNNNWLPVTGKW